MILRDEFLTEEARMVIVFNLYCIAKRLEIS
jgi:hypothetical protein